MGWSRRIGMALLGVLLSAQLAAAQSDGWNVALYPLLGWIPLGIGAGIDVPPFDGGAGGAGDVMDHRLDGALFGGVSISKANWRVDANLMWIAFGGDRVEAPAFSLDTDVVYGHGSFGVRIVPDLYASFGVRRLATRFDVKFANQPNFERTPGLWDPLLGLGYHRLRRNLDVHAVFEGGGVGMGADVDLGGAVQLDFKPVRFFGISAGYNVLYLKISDDEHDTTFTVHQTLHGPVIGIGFYF